MTDVLIRDVPDGVIAALDSRASRPGLSRSEYVRRRLAQDAAASRGRSAPGTWGALPASSASWPTLR